MKGLSLIFFRISKESQQFQVIKLHKLHRTFNF